ncbi:PREDICTED: early nodulin-like protein 1 [Ipomoea nil]|uniref:early nodulin-like protein 1 n=1 Tax=Ipomoea nil TaxID=35883 RepID=UPI000901ECA2|nr:PREDICTED: early nodulin-like protein 1 [Ipomoea nil]XP_019172418.1 PREDICTED: early nodulin-like protein 1 [Ipomoea nil]
MGSNVVVFVSYLLLMGFVWLCEAHTFYVGGKDGWVLQPVDGLNRWAGEIRFQINDTVIFRYKKGEDSVLVVNKRDYYDCNKTNPIDNLTDGNSSLTLTRSGEFFFISGHADNCEKGQKLIIIVMSPQHSKPPTVIPPPPPPPSPSPTSSTPLSPAPAPAPAQTPDKSTAMAVHASVGTLWGSALLLAPLFMMSLG